MVFELVINGVLWNEYDDLSELEEDLQGIEDHMQNYSVIKIYTGSSNSWAAWFGVADYLQYNLPADVTTTEPR